VPRDELWTTAGVLVMIAGDGAIMAVEAVAGEMPCVGSISVCTGVVAGTGAAGDTFEEIW